jgi:hypothetical protein
VGTGPDTHSVQGSLGKFLKELDIAYPGALHEMMLAEQKKTAGYPDELPQMLDQDGKVVR